MFSLKTHITIDPLYIGRISPENLGDGFIFKGTIHHFGFIKIIGALFFKKGNKTSQWSFSLGKKEVWIYYPDLTKPVMTQSQGIKLLTSNLDFIWRYTQDPNETFDVNYKTLSAPPCFQYRPKVFSCTHLKTITAEETYSPSYKRFHAEFEKSPMTHQRFSPLLQTFNPTLQRQEHD